MILRYGAALLIVLAAAGVRWALQPAMGVAPPYITFYLAVVMAAALGGFGPGLLATFVGGLLGLGLATLPLEKLQLTTLAEQVRLVIYLLSGFGISLIAGRMHEARRQAREEAEQLRQTTEELRLANERLLEADRSKDRFLAVLSHELRNPLMPIKHSLHVLEQMPADGGESVRRARATIGRQVDQMTRLVNDLLDVSRITSDKLNLQHDRLDLRQVVSSTVEDHRAVFEARGIQLEDRLPEHSVWIHGDASRLSQVVGNLLHNAAKFTSSGGEVRVSLEQRDGQAVLGVQDNGAGIPGDLLPSIFDPFTQAERKPHPAAGGLGLGLALVKRLVEVHGGSVEVRSEGEGKGAEFTITLPAESRSAAVTTHEAVPLSSSPRRVLVIEDSADNAEALSALLKSSGHEVDVCHSGLEGIRKAKLFHPDAVLCNIGLPGIDGYELARALRQGCALRPATLVALTGHASEEDRSKAQAAGFDWHLAKPPSVQELERVLRESRQQ